jgi:hypothetical protein
MTTSKMSELSEPEIIGLTPDPTLPASQPGPRRLFKNRPVWGSASNKPATPKPQPEATDQKKEEDPLGTFSRSRDTFRLVQEQEARTRRERERAAEEKAKHEKEQQREEAEITRRETEPARKKRRVSVELEDSEEDPVLPEDDDNDYRSSINDLDRPTTPTQIQSIDSPRSMRSSAKKNSVVIDALDHDGGKNRDAYYHNMMASIGSIDPQPPYPNKKPINLDDDDEIFGSKLPPSNNHLSASAQPFDPYAPLALSPQPTGSAPPPSQAPSPILSLLIHSSLPDTSPLLVKRRLNQRLKEVRTAWLTKQQTEGHLPASFDHATVFLTWRGKRLFDFTTCKSLGVGVDEITGEVIVKGGSSSAREEREWEEQAAGNAQLVFEAVTEAILADKKKEAARPKTLEPALTKTDGVTSSGGMKTQPLSVEEYTPSKARAVEVPDAAQSDEKIKITLRAGKEYDDYKLAVRSVRLPYHAQFACFFITMTNNIYRRQQSRKSCTHTARGMRYLLRNRCHCYSREMCWTKTTLWATLKSAMVIAWISG